MKMYKLDEMKMGWFVGQFAPTTFQTPSCEVAVKYYKTGDYDANHYHKEATEITAIVDGTVKMNDVNYIKGDIIVISPNETTDFLAVTDAITVVVKVPGALNDKYLYLT